MMRTKEEINKFLKEQCVDCENEGLYTCKLILDENGKCMFFKKYDKDNPPKSFGGY